MPELVARWWGRAATLTLLATAASSCSVSGPEPSEAQLAAARERWAEAGISSYAMTVTRGSLTGTPIGVRVTVAQRVVTDRRFTETGGAVPPEDASLFPDVEGLFNLVEDAFERAAAVSVTFDAIYGFPISIVIDFVLSTLTDDVTVGVTEFTPAGGAAPPR